VVTDNLTFLQALLQLGWPAIVLIQCVVLWRDNQELRMRIFNYLESKDRNELLGPPQPSHTDDN